MAQVSKINPVNIGNIVASGSAKTSSAKSKFSDIMSSSTGNSENHGNNSQTVSSIQTTKEKLQESASAAKNLHNSSETDYKQVNNTVESQPTEQSDVALEEALESVVQLKEQISKILDISLDELEKVMAFAGFTAMDLLEPNTLQDLLLQVNGVNEPTELLTNEGLCNQMKELLETVERFTQSVDLQEFSKASEVLAATEFSEVLEQKRQPADMKEDMKPAEESSVEEQPTVTKEPVITVQKEETSGKEQNQSGRNKSNEHTDYQHVQLNQFVQKLSESVQQTGQVEMDSVERLQQMQDIVNQVVERIKVTLSSDSTSMEMQLNPENLGKVNVSVVSKNGEMTAAFIVENQLAKEALESQMTTLRENLNEQGIKVDAIEVMVAEQGLSQDQFSNKNGESNFQNQSKRRGNLGKLRGVEDSKDETEEEEEVQAVRSNGTVDFSA